MEYLILLVVIFGVASFFVNEKELDADEQRDQIRKSIQKDAMFQIGRNWIVEGNRRG